MSNRGWTRRPITLLAGLLWLYQLSRLWNLGALPMFLDESVYLYWARQFRLMGDLAGPLRETTMLQPVILGLFPGIEQSSPDTLLFMGRWLVAAAGALTVVLIYVLGRDLMSEPVGLIAAAGYVLSPFSLFYDRMALTDGPLTLCVVACMWLSLRLVYSRKWGDAVCLGVILVLGAYLKIKGLFYLVVPIAAWVALGARSSAAALRSRFALAYGVAAVLLVPLLLAGAGYIQFEYSNKAAVAADGYDQAGQFLTNCALLWEWLQGYVPGGALAAVLALSVMGALGLGRRVILLLSHVLVLVLFYLVVARTWYPRYVLPIMPSLWLCTAAGIWVLARWLRQKQAAWARAAGLAGAVAVLLLLLPSLGFDRELLTDPALAPFPAIERWQYVAGWPAGYGLPEVSAFLDAAAADSADGVEVARIALPGLANEGLSLWAQRSPAVHLHELQYSNLVRQLNALGKQRPVYLVLELPRYTLGQLDPRISAAARVFEAPRPGDESGLVIYRWQP